MSTNPLNGVFINGLFYNYVDASYTRTSTIKNSSNVTQTSKTFSVTGLDFNVHTIALNLDSFYNPIDFNNNKLGMTTYLGVSRVAELRGIMNYPGMSLPLTLVIMDGTTHLVVPTGSFDVSIAYDQLQDTKGVEYRVNLTLEDVQ